MFLLSVNLHQKCQLHAVSCAVISNKTYLNVTNCLQMYSRTIVKTLPLVKLHNPYFAYLIIWKKLRGRKLTCM